MNFEHQPPNTDTHLISEADADRIATLEKSAFDWSIEQADIDALKEHIRSPNVITVIVKGVGEGIAGYVVGVPSLTEAELVEEDEAFKPSEHNLYIETINIAPEYQRQGLATKLLQLLITHAQDRGYQTISAHTPPELLNLYRPYLHSEPSRTIPNWYDSGEDHTYIEIDLDEDKPGHSSNS